MGAEPPAGLSLVVRLKPKPCDPLTRSTVSIFPVKEERQNSIKNWPAHLAHIASSQRSQMTYFMIWSAHGHWRLWKHELVEKKYDLPIFLVFAFIITAEALLGRTGFFFTTPTGEESLASAHTKKRVMSAKARVTFEYPNQFCVRTSWFLQVNISWHRQKFQTSWFVSVPHRRIWRGRTVRRTTNFHDTEKDVWTFHSLFEELVGAAQI
jgi:hypothetical protein